jgi:hypothetical protein
MKFLPSMLRVLGLNALVAAVLSVFFLPMFQISSLMEALAARPDGQPLREVTVKLFGFTTTLARAVTLFPWLAAAGAAIILLLIVTLQLRQIPKYVEVLPDGVNFGRWLAADHFIPYRRISGTYERPHYRYPTGAVCIFDLDGHRHHILKYAYPDWPLLHQEIKNRIESA